MAKSNSEIKPQQPDCDGFQFARNPYAQGDSAYYDVSYTNAGEVPESGVFNPDGPFYQSGGKSGTGEGQFRSALTADDGERLENQMQEIKPHAQDFADKRSTLGVDAGRANRGSDDGYGPNQPSAERDTTDRN